MKIFLIIISLFLVSIVSGCSIKQNNVISTKTSNNPITDHQISPVAEKLSDPIKVDQSIYSNKLGLEVSYYSSSTILAKEDKNKIYFYWKGQNYTAGQYLEVFSKNADIDFKDSIKKRFLNKKAIKDGCFVKIIKETDDYKKAIIDYSDNDCPDGNPAWTCASCSEYQKGNGVRYFIYYKKHPTNYLFISIGQYSLLEKSLLNMKADKISSLYNIKAKNVNKFVNKMEWFNNIKFIK